MLKLKYKKKEDIPDGAQLFYTKKGEEWALQIEGIPNADEVKRTNDLLAIERDKTRTLETKFGKLGDLDPDKMAELMELSKSLGDDFDATAFESMKTELDTLKAGRNVDLAGIQDQLVEQKRNATQLLKENSSLKRKFDESDGERNNLQVQINRTTIHSELRTMAEAAKVLPEAIPDILLYGDILFELDAKRNVVAKDGLPDLLTGTSPVDWLTSCQPNKPHWWARSSSAGGVGGAGGGFSGKNPWKADSKNLTEQGKIFVDNPDLARSLAKEAGVEL